MQLFEVELTLDRQAGGPSYRFGGSLCSSNAGLRPSALDARQEIIVPIMAARVTLKAVNDELMRLGHCARLEKASGYFYFWSEDSAGWIDRTVRVARLNSLTLDQWIGEYLWLKKINAEMTKPNRVKPWINS